jgi:hypothetical protein
MAKIENLKRNKKTWVAHPFILSCLPVLILFAFNVHEILVRDIILPITISIAVSIISWFALRYFLKGIKAGLVISTLILLFVIYGNVLHLLQLNDNTINQFLASHFVLGPIFLTIGIFAILFFIKTKAFTELNSIFNVIAITIIGILILNAAVFYVSDPIDNNYSKYIEIPITSKNIEEKPNIVVLLFDEFAGKKQLKNDFNHDLIPFERDLQKRGFQIPKNSFSNYPNSALSIPSFMNMNYLDFLTELEPDSKNMRVSIQLEEQNNVMKILKSYGFKITTFYGGFDDGVEIPASSPYVDEKLCGSDLLKINAELKRNFVTTYLPLGFFHNTFLISDKVECISNYIINYKSDTTQPHYIHAHFRLPHDPFMYDSEGNHIDIKKNDDKQAYLEQVLFAEKKIIELVDSIQKRSPETVIILLSDHGFRGDIDWENPSDENIIRGFNNISALYFPDKNIELPNKLSLVNIFRIFFNEYFEADYELLEDKQIWYIPTKPYTNHIDMADRLDSIIKK